MTTANPRDPRLRRASHRAPVDALSAAVRLEVAADAMRAQQLDRGLEVEVEVERTPAELLADEYAAASYPRAVPNAAQAAAMLGTVEPPLSAVEFAAALEPAIPTCDDAGHIAAGYHLGSSCAAPVFADALLEAPVLPPPPLESLFSSERSLTWRSRHDERSRLFGVRSRLPGSAPIVDKVWAPGPVLDQGTEGACVGAAVAGATNVLRLATVFAAGGGPLSMLDLEDAVDLYERAKELDTIPGEDYSGTSVLAGLQAAVEARLIGGYLWAFGTRDVAQAVLQTGPVIVGVPWLSNMYDTGAGGLVELSGDDTGLGHCLAVVGIRRTGPQGQPGPYFVWQNSWGPTYGDGGLGYIHHRDLATLLRGRGEAAIPTRDAQAPA